MVVSYGTSPAAEVMFAKTPLSDAPTASITGPDTCFRQIEFVGILKGTKQRRPGRKIRGLHAEREISGRHACANVCLSGAAQYRAAGCIHEVCAAVHPACLAFPDEIAANRDAWIQAWTDAVLK